MSGDLEAHARRIAELVSELEGSPDSEAKARTFELLENVDHLHRSCVWRLFELLTELGGKGLVDRVATDPAVKTLFVLYDLIPSQPLRPVESTAPVSAPGASGFVPLREVRGLPPSWKVAFAREDLPPGSLQAVEIDGTPVVIASLDDGRIFAYRNACPGSVLPLHLGTLADGLIHCPWHGCRYDARSGRRVQGEGGNLDAFSVSVDKGTIRVATNLAPAKEEKR